MAPSAAATGGIVDDFGRYEISLFAITQLGYLPVTGSLLATNFFERSSSEACLNGSTVEGYEFHSLLVEWQLTCSKDHFVWIFSLTDLLSTALMLGALLGAFVAGFLADRYGRKPPVVGSIAIIGACNTLLCVLGMRSSLLSGLLFLIMGAAAGGYMVVNLVLMIEAVQHSRSRLLIVSLNGWPLAMCFTAAIAFLTRHWLLYHGVIAATSFLLFAVLLISADVSVHEVDGNRRTDGTVCLDTPKYSYTDLFKHRSIGISVVALAYCFTVSSFVSFSGYFHTSILPGDRFLNLFSMGILKLLLGMIPFVCGSYLGRRPIFLTSVATATLTNCALTFMLSNSQLNSTIYVSLLSVLMTSALDPSFKIMHLYSAELFPTGVRNMARGICQVGARLGSVLAPIMRSFYGLYPVASMALCVCLLAVQWLVAFCVFPETSRRQLPDKLPDQQNLSHSSKSLPCQVQIQSRS